MPGIPRFIFFFQRNHSEMLLTYLQISADDDYRMTFGEMRTHIIRMALNLKNIDMQMGDVICIVAKNNRYVAPVAFGSLLIGLTVSTMDPFFNTSEMVHALSLSNPKLVFCDEENLTTVITALKLSNIEALICVFTENTDSASKVKSIFELLQAHPGEKEFM
jgi:4-coumarate--CoA ligase